MIAFGIVTAVALLGGAVPGVVAWAVASAGTILFYLRRGRAGRPVRTAPPHRGAADECRVLVLANDALADESLVAGRLVEEIQRSTAGYRARVNVVCPLHTSTIRHWVSDLDGARAEAKNRVQRAVEVLRVHGCETRGEIGDEDALQAIEDELRTFGADEIIVLTRHGARAGELDPSIVEQARTRFALPITHLVAESRPEPARA
ncbi:MAG TPA: hypothetical protein VFT80_14050 [Actinomycetota bacterium]|nr:hypothetical protein [Actinomycetota bacterium]